MTPSVMSGGENSGEGGQRDSVAPGPSVSSESPDRAAPKRLSIPSLPGGSRANYRIAVAAVWVVVQAILVVTAGRRIDGPFDFRAESESSTIKLVLWRDLWRDLESPDTRTARAHVDDGVWSSRGRDSRNHRQVWYDRVPTPYWVFDRDVPASSERAELSKLQGALDDVASHLSLEDDVETRRLVLDVTVRRNGREPVAHQLVSRERFTKGEP